MMTFSMKSFVWNPRLTTLVNGSSLYFQRKELNLRAFSSSSAEISNQSRGGLPRFFSETLPLYKASMIELFDGKGHVVKGRIEKIDRAGLEFEALENPKSVSPITMKWHVFAAFGTLKGGRADWLVEKCTELGACSITPLLTQHSHSISENRMDRFQRVIQAAAKQCQRLHEIILKPPMNVGELLHIVAQSKLSFVAVAEATPVFSALSLLKKEPAGIMIIGPEGDFTEEELNSIKEAGAIAVGLGPHRLRVETATMALLTTLMLWSDSQEIPNH